MNREQRRRLNKHQTLELLQEVKAEVASAFLLCAPRVLVHKYNWNMDQIHVFLEDLIEEYNSVDDFQEYKRKVYEEDGIGILQEDEAKLLQ